MAVYTDITEEDLEAFVAQYDIGGVLAAKGIAEGIQNSNFLLHTETGPFILTVYEKWVDPGELPFFLDLMEHLAAEGVPCPLPVKGRDGRALRSLAGKPAAVVTFLKGFWPKKPQPWHCAELGGAMANMHLAAQGFAGRRENSLAVPRLPSLFAACRDRADEVMPNLATEIATELEALAAHWPVGDALPRGVIHADLFPDNVFFSGDTLSGLIDFYFACEDFFAYDLAICLNAWCFESDGQFNITKARLMLNAYRKVRPFSEAELAALPWLARGAALRFLLTRLYDWLNTPAGSLGQPKDPLEYWHKLRFHRAVKGPGEYGLD